MGRQTTSRLSTRETVQRSHKKLTKKQRKKTFKKVKYYSTFNKKDIQFSCFEEEQIFKDNLATSFKELPEMDFDCQSSDELINDAQNDAIQSLTRSLKLLKQILIVYTLNTLSFLRNQINYHQIQSTRFVLF